MSEWSGIQASLQSKMQTRSLGVKLIVVCGLALLMTIPGLFVWGLIGERTRRADDVTKELSSYAGGRQTFLGPTLAIPYDIPARSAAEGAQHGTYLIFPEQATGEVKTSTHERQRSLFKVPVYQAYLKLHATFDLTGAPAAAPVGAVLDWNRAELLVGVSDPRGALADATMEISGKSAVLAPAASAASLSIRSAQGQQLQLTLFGAHAAGIARPGALFNVTADLHFSGAQRIAVLAYGKTTHLTVTGDWPNPGFDGGFLPTNRAVSKNGFRAEWSVPFIARGVCAEGDAASIMGLGATALGVSYIELVDPYQSVSRSLKYVPLFLGLVFLSYFLFEATTGKRVHPAQYILVGIAQLIFYLLLLSLAERIGFDWGFLVAGAATVFLMAANASWVFASAKQGYRALAIFTLLYGLIYTLLRLEDNALLVGAIASFVAIAAVMYFTRRIDWYSSLPAIQIGMDSKPAKEER